MSREYVLTINGGSSTIKFGVFTVGSHPIRVISGNVSRIKNEKSNFTYFDEVADQEKSRQIKVSDNASAAFFILDWLKDKIDFSLIKSVGHRIVHGMNHFNPEKVTPKIIKELTRFIPSDPEHLPRELELIKVFSRRYPKLLQIVFFDTEFHKAMPTKARRFPIPRRFFDMGIQRYGFHGLSYAYLMGELSRIYNVKKYRGRVILAHLGHGASFAAVKNGASVDTSMGFTPAGGIMMGTRPGDLDPGVIDSMMKHDHLSLKKLNEIINRESGLIGVSKLSSDMQTLIKNKSKNRYAREAIELFCYQAKKSIGSFAAALGGLDMLVFSAGIGENSSYIRAEICSGLKFLGIDLDESKNNKNELIISKSGSFVTVRVIHTDEELYMANLMMRLK